MSPSTPFWDPSAHFFGRKSFSSKMNHFNCVRTLNHSLRGCEHLRGMKSQHSLWIWMIYNVTKILPNNGLESPQHMDSIA